MQDGETVPVDYCVTTVARLGDQPAAPMVAILGLQEQLRTASPEQFYYPAPSIHVSLLGCTQRRSDPGVFAVGRIQAIGRVCEQVITGRGPVRLALRGIGITGNQVFVQVLPRDRAWEALRRGLEDALLAIGEEPISYPNKGPIHMNIARVIRADSASISALLARVDDLHDVDAGEVTITTVSFLLTDFLLSPRHTWELGSFRLG
jgi:hypothetical protein